MNEGVRRHILFTIRTRELQIALRGAQVRNREYPADNEESVHGLISRNYRYHPFC